MNKTETTKTNENVDMPQKTDEATAPSSTSSGNLKNFRHHPEMENFYRFVYENDLRFEALEIINEVLTEKRARKQMKKKKSTTH